MKQRAGALVLAGAVLYSAAYAGEDVGWYTASAQAHSVRS